MEVDIGTEVKEVIHVILSPDLLSCMQKSMRDGEEGGKREQGGEREEDEVESNIHH